jgi:hypothetical protein
LLCLFCAWVIVNWNAPVVEILRYFPNNVWDFGILFLQPRTPLLTTPWASN